MMSSENSLPLATLKTIYLQELRRGSTGEKEKLFAAAQDNGIFYLDFTEDLGEHRISDLIQNIYSLSQSLFDLDLDEKMQYDVDQISKLKLNGCVSDCRFIVSCLALLTFYSYKPISRNIGGIEGQRDGFESYAVPRNGILGFNPFIHPPLLDNHINLLQNFLLTCIGISQNIFEALSTPLNLPTSYSLDKFHRPDAPAPDILRLLKYAASNKGDQEFRVPQTPHTDLGSLTMLFADSPGLQIKPDGCDDWLYIEPKENHAVINLGDAMSLWSGGRYRSVLHRVASLPGMGMGERYSFAFLMRPENHAPMVSLTDGLSGLDGGVLTSEEWIRAKFGVLRGETEKNRTHILTGREVAV